MDIRGGRVAWLLGGALLVLAVLGVTRMRAERAPQAVPEPRPPQPPRLAGRAGGEAATAGAASDDRMHGTDAGEPGPVPSEAELMQAARAALERAPERALESI